MPSPGQDRQRRERLPRPDQHLQFGDESAEPGKPIEATLAMTKVTAANGIAWLRFMPLQRRQIARVGAVINHAADDGEQQPGDDAVREHLQHRAAQADRVQRHQAQQHKSHVADAGIADDEFEVLLHQRHRRAIHDADDRQQRKHVAP